MSTGVDEGDTLLGSCEVGQSVAVLSAVDGLWHRAQLTSINEDEDEFEVLLVDVGRSEKMQRLRLLQHDLMTTAVSLLRLHTQFDNRLGNLPPK